MPITNVEKNRLLIQVFKRFASIKKEMKNVRIAFEKIEDVTVEQMKGGKVKPGYSFCDTHMVFDIKMDGLFTRKARLVADGHRTSAVGARIAWHAESK